MANELSITYNGQTKTKDSGVVLNTAGRVMVTNMTITAAADPHTLYTPSSTYFKTGTSGAVSGASISSNKYSSATYYVKAATPAFDGGGVTGTATLGITPTNTGLTSTNASGIAVEIGVSQANIARKAVLYNGAVNGWVEKDDDATALAQSVVTMGSSKSNIYVSGTGTKYINNITVPTGKTLTVTSVVGTLDVNSSSTVVAGTVNINGGAINRGVQVKANKEAVVDGFTVTYSTTATVNGVTFYAGDLKVPVYNGTTLTYPDPGIFSASAGTTTMSITGNVTTINGLAVKDVNAVTGSGTASTSYSNTYLAKWNTASSLTTGPKVTISSSTPSGGSAGDIWYQTL